MEVISRKEAKEKGLSFYYTGKPCKYGHYSEKYTCSGTCTECARIRKQTPEVKAKDKEYRENQDPDEVKAYKQKWYYDNHEYNLQARKDYYSENSEEINQKRREDRERIRTVEYEYHKKNREENNEIHRRKLARKSDYDSRRRARCSVDFVEPYKEENKRVAEEKNIAQGKLKQCVVSDDPYDLILNVDHIIPLNGGNLVSGLHYPVNMQIIPARENFSKNNSFTPYAINHLTGEVTHYG